jgi:hypothetical protein
VGGDLGQVMGAHAGGEEGLMGVAHGGVGEEDALFSPHPGGEGGGAQGQEPVPRARGRVPGEIAGGLHRRCHGQGGQGPALHLWVAVDPNITEKSQQAVGAVAALAELEQLRRFVDETGGALPRQEERVVDDVFQEGQVGGQPPHPELAQGAVHAPRCFLGTMAPGGDLDQEGVVIGGDDGPGIGGAAIEADAKARRAAIGVDPAIIRGKAVLRVLGGDAALEGMAIEAHSLLPGHVRLIVAQARALGDGDLGLDDIHAGHQFGDGVFDLDARIDLDEVEIIVVGVHQEFDGAGVAVVGRPRQPQGRLAEFDPARLGQIGRRGTLHDLLVAALHRAVTLEEMDQLAVGVTQDLDLHMPRPPHQLFQIDLVVAEGRQGLASRDIHGRAQVGLGEYDPHTAPAAAPTGLEHQGIANGRRQDLGPLQVPGQGARRRHHGHPGLGRQLPRRDLVTQQPHDLGPGADEGDARGGAGLGEIGILREEAITGVDGIDLVLPGDADDVGDIQVGGDGFLAGAHQIGLVGLETVQGKAIFIGKNGDGTDTHLAGRAQDADGDFTAIGYKQPANFFHVATP